MRSIRRRPPRVPHLTRSPLSAGPAPGSEVGTERHVSSKRRRSQTGDRQRALWSAPARHCP
eukprot:15477400-Alexandrium_andersonii.AAC.1